MLYEVPKITELGTLNCFSGKCTVQAPACFGYNILVN